MGDDYHEQIASILDPSRNMSKVGRTNRRTAKCDLERRGLPLRMPRMDGRRRIARKFRGIRFLLLSLLVGVLSGEDHIDQSRSPRRPLFW